MDWCFLMLNGIYTLYLQPGIVMLSNLIVRPNAGQPLSMFLVISDSGKAEMIEIQVSYPPNREEWMEKIK